jgi:hypothetical protein
MLCSVAPAKTDVSDERIVPIIRVIRTGEKSTLTVTSHRSKMRRNTHVTLMVEAIHFSETSILTIATQHNISEDDILRRHRRGNLKSEVALTGWTL